MGRMTFIFRRLLQLIPVAIGCTIVVFFMIHLIPGDPARTILGIHATPRAVALLHKEWGLNRPLISQYLLFMDRLLHGNLGVSLYYGGSALSLILTHLPPTLWLIIYSSVLAVLISVPLAMIAASRKDGARDHAVRVVPPSLTVALALAPVVIRSLRASMLNVLGAEFVTTARSKGIAGKRLFLRHVLRNAVIPAVTVLGINIGFLIGGTVIIENVFAIPGLGQLMINSIFQRDFTVVQGITLVFAIMVILLNLAADVAYATLDPRVRFSR